MSTNSSAHPFTMRSLPAESRAQRVQRVKLSGSASRRRPQHPHRACAMSSPTRQTQWRSAQTIRGGDGDVSYGAGDEADSRSIRMHRAAVSRRDGCAGPASSASRLQAPPPYQCPARSIAGHGRRGALSQTGGFHTIPVARTWRISTPAPRCRAQVDLQRRAVIMAHTCPRGAANAATAIARRLSTGIYRIKFDQVSFKPELSPS
ncbi:hypothetical protein C8R47DRAFT_1087160 [Mycena vitilis]|nr:hypothetical protein C8R47DRAFT_1087160 [Mycena vitilis]